MVENSFDMGRTIDFYNENASRIILPGTLSTGISVEGELNSITARRLAGLRNCFPRNALERSVFRQVVAKPKTWFLHSAGELISKGETPTTTNREDAMSDSAIVPSFHCPVPLGDERDVSQYVGDVWLYDLPEDIIPNARVREIISAQGFVHEMAHTINFPSRFLKKQTLEFPNGEIISGEDAFNKFRELVKEKEPMSHYSSGYDAKDNFWQAVDEELSESVAAHFLGFIYCENLDRRLNPFVDRPEVREFIDNYLNAKVIR